jgi:hypothetical protein
MEDDMHTMTDRLGDIGGKLRERRTNSRIDHLDEENQRLRTELRSMRSTLDRERSDREEILDALKGKPKTVVKKKRGGLVRMAVIGGGAYVLGSRAGRERYEQIVAWARQMKDRGREATEDFKGDVVATAEGTGRRADTGSLTSGSGTAPITPGTTVSATTIKPTTKQDTDKGSGSTKSGAGNS